MTSIRDIAHLTDQLMHVGQRERERPYKALHKYLNGSTHSHGIWITYLLFSIIWLYGLVKTFDNVPPLRGNSWNE